MHVAHNLPLSFSQLDVHAAKVGAAKVKRQVLSTLIPALQSDAQTSIVLAICRTECLKLAHLPCWDDVDHAGYHEQ